MKTIYFILFFIISSSCFAQKSQVFEYYLYLNDYKNAPIFERGGDFSSYIGDDANLKSFFSNRTVINFYQAFPEYLKSDEILRVYLLTTLDENLISDLIEKYPAMIDKYDDITGRVSIPLSFYPNDYGNTSPATNTGANVSKKDLDFVKAPIAWSITRGNSSIKIGISDSGIDANAPDFFNKVTYTGGAVSYSGASHGSDVAAIAAARGDNGHGTVGVCMDCDIISGPMSFNAFYKMANEGAKVINTSWTNSGYTKGDGHITVEQDIINYLTDEYNVIFVAASGNMSSYSTPQSYHSFSQSGMPPATPFGLIYVYPASYDNVISVSSVNHKNPIVLPLNNTQNSYCCTSPLFPIHLDLENAIGRSVSALDPMDPISVIRNGYYQTPWNQDGLTWMNTTNDKVDIVAPGYDIFQYSYLLNGLTTQLYGSGTSYSAPMVTGTIGLMLSINECMSVKEVETVLKITSTDIESMQLNEQFIGHIGAGSLNTGDAVSFVNQMFNDNGNAVIANHRFNRFDFYLNRIGNNLRIIDVAFSEANTTALTAKNSIEILESDFQPNVNGWVDLTVDENISYECIDQLRTTDTNKNRKSDIDSFVGSKLYPNPNNGNFRILTDNNLKEVVKVNIFDTFGKLVHQTTSSEQWLTFNLLNLQAGMYIVKLTKNHTTETLKFIKY